MAAHGHADSVGVNRPKIEIVIRKGKSDFEVFGAINK